MTDTLNNAGLAAHATPPNRSVPAATTGETMRALAALDMPFKRMDERAIIPARSTDGAACFDLHALHGGVVPAGGSFDFSTGLAFEIPHGHVMFVFSRSGHAFKHGIRLVNSVGVIDSDYRGIVAAKLHNDGRTDFPVRAGDRIAQALVLPVPLVCLVEVFALTDTARGAGGFGSTGTA